MSGTVRYFSPYPLYFESGSGSRATDIDGIDFIDCFLCGATLLLGHRPPAVEASIQAHRDAGSLVLNPRLATEVAESLQAMIPAAERVRLVNSGTEAVLTAMRFGSDPEGRERARQAGLKSAEAARVRKELGRKAAVADPTKARSVKVAVKLLTDIISKHRDTDLSELTRACQMEIVSRLATGEIPVRNASDAAAALQVVEGDAAIDADSVDGLTLDADDGLASGEMSATRL